jgi:hypothetical protein
MLNLADPQKSCFIPCFFYIWDGTLFVPYIYFIDKTSSSCDRGYVEACTVNGHKYSSPSILRYSIYKKVHVFHIKPHFSIFFYCEVISKWILIIFAPEEVEIIKDYLFILA